MKGPFMLLALFSSITAFSQPTPCDNAIQIQCGETLPGTTLTGQDLFGVGDFSGCNSSQSPYDANDKVYELEIDSRRNIHINLEILSEENLDMFLLSECSVGTSPSRFITCASSTIENNTAVGGILFESIDFIANPGTYYIVIDGPNSNDESNFRLSIDCDYDCLDRPELGYPVHSDDFDQYLIASVSPQSNKWRKWSTNSTDAPIENDGTSNFLRIRRTSLTPDVIYDLDDLSPERHRLSFRMYIEPGAGGYFDILNRLPVNGQGENYVFKVLFASSGLATVVDNNNSSIGTFNYLVGVWNHVVLIVDPSNVVEIWINDEIVYSELYSLGGPLFPHKIAGLSFFANAGTNYRVDNICIWDSPLLPCPLYIDPVCIKNGVQFDNYCYANVIGRYTSAEWEKCFSVCDFGGSLIFRDDIFTDTLDDNDILPGLVGSDPCVLEAYSGNLPENYRGVIKVFYNDSVGDLGPQIPIGLMSDVKVFVFQCFEDPESGQVIQNNLGEVEGNSGCVFNSSPDDPIGLYYLVFIGQVDDIYGIQVFPSGDCDGSITTIVCNETKSGSLVGEDNDYEKGDQTGAYGKCYNGFRNYQGRDKVYRFDLIEPSVVNVSLTADDQKAVFIYNYLCAKICLGYAETPNNGGTGTLSGISLSAGTYYLIVDTQVGADPGFSLTLNCEIDTNYFINIVEDFGECPIVENQDSNHTYRILAISSPNELKPGAFVSVGYREGNESVNVVSDFWKNNPSQPFSLPLDSIGDSNKCGFELNDTIDVSLFVQPNGDTYNWIPCKATYQPLSQLNSAQDQFLPGGSSTVMRLDKKSVYNFFVSATSMNFNSLAGSDYITIVREGVNLVLDYDSITNPWLHIVKGNPNVEIIVDANPDQAVREAILTARFESNPVFIQKIKIAQNGFCIKPDVSFNILPGGNSVCINQDFSVQAYVTNGLDEFYSFRWSTGNTTPIIDGLGLPLQSYTVTVTERSCNQETKDSITIQGFPVPVANAGQDKSTCKGIPTTLTAALVNGASYLWNTGQNAQSIEVNPQSSTVYVLTVTNNGCSDIDSVLVTVIPLPIVDLGANKTICSDSSVTLASMDVPGNFYSWSTGATSSSITVSPDTDTNYGLTVTNNGCSDFDDVLVIVNQVPVAEVGADVEICSNSSVSLSTLDSPGYSFKWSTGEITDSIVVTPTINTQYKVTVSHNGCSSVDSVLVNVFPPETWNIDIDSIECFGGQDGQISLSPGSGQNGLSYSWSNGNVNAVNSNLVAGLYTVTAEDANGCSQVLLTEMTQPAELEIVRDSITHPSDSSFGRIKVSIFGGTPPYQINWYLGDSTIMTGDSVIQDIDKGCYKVLVTDSKGCIDSIDCIKVALITLGDQAFNIFPNPSGGLVYLVTNENMTKEVSLYVLNSVGEVILSERGILLEKNNPYTINLFSQAPGIYFLHLQVGTTIGIQKLVKN